MEYRTPEQGVCTRLQDEGTAPGFDDGFADGVRNGRITVMPPVARFSEHEVRFVDQMTASFDVVLLATGYRNGLSRLLGHLNVLDDQGRPKVNAPDIDPVHPGLWIFGMLPKLEGNIYARTKEARRLARIIARTLHREIETSDLTPSIKGI